MWQRALEAGAVYEKFPILHHDAVLLPETARVAQTQQRVQE